MSTPALPRLMLIADGFASGRANQTADDVQRQVVVLVEAGLSFVQLRDHAADAGAFEDAARALTRSLRTIQPRVTFVVNSRPVTADELGCGVHVGMRAAQPVSPFYTAQGVGGRGVKPQPRPLGYSAHSLSEIQRAATTGLDYATFSPIFPTTTHPDSPPVGLEALSEACAAAPDLPVFALGGITPERARDCLGAGAYGVAVLSGLLGAKDPTATARAFLTQLKR